MSTEEEDRIAQEDSRPSGTPPLVSQGNDFEKLVQKFHTDNASFPRSGSVSDLIVYANFPCDTTNQKHYPDLASSDMSSVWNSCTCFSDVISCGNQQCVKKCWLVSQGKDRKETKLITDPLMIMVSSVKYTFK